MYGYVYHLAAAAPSEALRGGVLVRTRCHRFKPFVAQWIAALHHEKVILVRFPCLAAFLHSN